jgi:hypothetical protein
LLSAAAQNPQWSIAEPDPYRDMMIIMTPTKKRKLEYTPAPSPLKNQRAVSKIPSPDFSDKRIKELKKVRIVQERDRQARIAANDQGLQEQSIRDDPAFKTIKATLMSIAKYD